MRVRQVGSVLVLLLLGGLLLAAPTAAQDRLRLTGSGASFPFPLYGQWFKDYSKAHQDVIIDYQAKGSGAGIRDFINKTVDFAASDAAMTDEEMAQVKDGVQLLPMTAGTIVLSYNLPGGPEELRLSREVYPKIFLGEITKWNDPAIAKANPGATLPDTDITVVRRADSSGTTFVFTQHLSAISEAWKKGPGTGAAVNWPSSDKIVAEPKNDGVTATIKQTPGAIGYIEYSYAKLAKVPMALLENKAGQFVKPTEESGKAALASVHLPADLRAWLPDPDGAESYPIATYTWMLFYKKYDDPKKATALREVVQYCLTDGQKMSEKLGYIALPEHVVQAASKAAENIQ
ncbi:MAG TPA: phosphate ABC transporter substrate-binding protein PstS [Candidatus Binatia bacterium]|nr:phosphate ABC transporter substrate-binding protein PstS [Candidatus Binatia bacterium]